MIVFGTDASIESLATVGRIDPTEDSRPWWARERTDLAGAIRLGTAAFPETGQKRLVLLSDGNENIGDAMAAVLAAKPLGVTVDVVPLGVTRGNDVSVQKVQLPGEAEEGPDVRGEDFRPGGPAAATATVRLYRNEQLLGEQKVNSTPGKNLFTFPADARPSRASTATTCAWRRRAIRCRRTIARSASPPCGAIRACCSISADPEQDAQLAAALRSANLEVKRDGLSGFPDTLAEMQSYDAIFHQQPRRGRSGPRPA